MDEQLPVGLDDLTAQWFSQALDRHVTDATVVDRSSGTTGRARASRCAVSRAFRQPCS